MAESESNIAGEKLMSLIQRIERLEEDRANIGADIREIYREAKGIGFEPKIIRQLVKMRKMEASDRQEEEALIESYMAAIGMASSLAMHRDGAINRPTELGDMAWATGTDPARYIIYGGLVASVGALLFHQADQMT